MDAAFLRRCQTREPRAWRELYKAYARRVYRWAVLRGLRPPEAEDAAQEVLVTAHRRIETCRAPEAFDAWLYQITRRVVANARRRVWWKRVMPVETVPEPAFEGTHLETDLAVRACLAKLPQAQAEVLMLADVEGYTRDEVAKMIGKSPGTVASRLRLGRANFRKIWADCGPQSTSAVPLETL